MSEVLYIIIPAFNESANIAQVVSDWYPVVEKHDGGGRSRLVVIDDGSSDDTYKVVRRCAENRPLLQVLTKQNAGHGPTVLFGYQYAIRNGADFIFQTDSDGQTLASEFESFWNRRNQFDLVIGWRKNREDGRQRVFVTRTLRMVIRLCFGVNCRDANTPYRLMRADRLQEILPMIPGDAFLANVLVTVAFTKKKYRVLYLPITFRPRQGGKNSIDMKKITRVGKKALRDFTALNRAWNRKL